MQTNDTWTLGGREFHSRFILGSGKYSLRLIEAAVRDAGAEIITLAVRRANTKEHENILDYIPKGVTLLPNTSGARNAEEAVRIARLARELGCGDFVKIEIMRDTKYLLPDNQETIRATVVGAGSHSTELSGSTIYYRDIAFPLKNLPILKLTGEEERGDAAALAQCIRDKLGWFADEGGLSPLALALRGEGNPSYARVDELARGIAGGLEPLRAQGIAPVVLVEADQAKVLGQAMAQRVEGPLLCLDSVGVDNGDYIDIGAPVAGGAVLPVVIKTLVFNKS